MPSRCRSAYRFSIGLASLAVVVLFSGEAAAGCGDYVRIAGAAPSDVSPAHQTTKNPPYLPCSGPNCSADPDSPVIPFGFPVNGPSEGKNSALRVEGIVADAAPTFWSTTIEDEATESRRIDPIFHPPRG